MKTDNIFDYMNPDSENIEKIDEQTVYEQTGIDPENVKEILMKKLHPSKPKKHMTKRAVMTLIAAAVGIGILGTVSAGAAGSFNAVFGEHFAGEMVNGVYSGGNVHLTTNENLNGEFLGVAGDDKNVMAAIRLTKKDGSAFTEDYKNVFTRSIDIGDETRNGMIDTMEDEDDGTAIKVTQALWSRIFDRSDNVTQSFWSRIIDGSAGGIVEEKTHCIFSDNNTIQFYISYGTYNRNIKGETLTVKQKSLYVYHIDEYLFKNDDRYLSDEEEEQIKKITEERRSTLKDDQVMLFTDDEENYVIATKSKITLNLDCSCQLNYKNTDRCITPVDTEFGYTTADDGTFIPTTDKNISKYISYKMNDIQASSYQLSLDFTIDQGYYLYDVSLDNEDVSFRSMTTLDDFSDFIFQNVTITLENGRTIKCLISSASGTGNEDDTVTTLAEFSYRDENDDWLTINPSEIKSVQIGGNIITAE